MERIKTYEVFVAMMATLEEDQRRADENEDTKAFEKASYGMVDLLEEYPLWGKRYTEEKQKENKK